MDKSRERLPACGESTYGQTRELTGESNCGAATQFVLSFLAKACALPSGRLRLSPMTTNFYFSKTE